MVAARSTFLSPSPLPSRSLAGRAGYRFTAQTMIEGFACHARGVEVKSHDPKRIHARVRGKRTHEVQLAADDGKLIIACSCAALSMGVDVCKHSWAALLEVDKMGGLESLANTRGTLVVEGTAFVESPASKTERDQEEAAPPPTDPPLMSTKKKGIKKAPSLPPPPPEAPTKPRAPAKAPAKASAKASVNASAKVSAKAPPKKKKKTG